MLEVASIRKARSIPKGKQIYHSCKHYWCVNPKHLKALDQLSRLNKVDGWQAKENARKTRCPKGHPYEEGNINITMIKNQGWRACLICQREKYQRNKAAKKLYNKKRYLRMKEFLKNIMEVNKEESLIIEDNEIEGTKEDLLIELNMYHSVGGPHKITDTPRKVRIESSGWSLKCKNSRGKMVHRIDIDHITVGVITIDIIKKKVMENGKEIKLMSDFHLGWNKI